MPLVRKKCGADSSEEGARNLASMVELTPGWSQVEVLQEDGLFAVYGVFDDDKKIDAESNSPFHEALAKLLETWGMSQRELSRRTRAGGREGLSHVTISFLLQGKMEPSARAMESVAAVLGVFPRHFAEYRLFLAREALDPKVVGLDEALRNLDKVSSSLHLLMTRRKRD